MKIPSLIIVSVQESLTLRSASENDLENLRLWKNENREFFFNKTEITVRQQADWFLNLSTRAHDYMFMVDLGGQSIGCMGVRLLGVEWDVYNVILGLQDCGGKGFMSQAFNSMLKNVGEVNKCPINLKVLKNNPAVTWYKKNGFVITGQISDYFTMSYQVNCN